MVIFHSYVKLPEGKLHVSKELFIEQKTINEQEPKPMVKNNGQPKKDAIKEPSGVGIYVPWLGNIKDITWNSSHLVDH